jgi:hypothetical protein
MSSTRYEVYVSADEPWHAGLRRGYRTAVLSFCECNTSDVTEVYDAQGFGFDDADAQLATFCGDDYDGYGQNAHPDADQFVFTRLEVAERFADELRSQMHATIVICTLEVA